MAEQYHGRQRAYSTLAADIEEFVASSKERLEAVVKQSLQDVVVNAQTPVAKGGRMRVDTGFLWASGRASLGGWPEGPNIKPPSAGPNTFAFDGEAVISVLGNLKLGDTFFFGWTANYAQYRELYDGFLEASLQNWSRYVAFNTDTLRQRIS